MCELTRTAAPSLIAEDINHSTESTQQQRPAAGGGPTGVSQPPNTQQDKGRFYKIWKYYNSSTCYMHCLILFILNVIQVVVYLLALFVVQSRAISAVNYKDWDYISDHIPDRYIDYEFLENLSVL